MKFLVFSLSLFITTAFAQWEALNPITDNTWLWSIYFSDDDNGWVAGTNGTILKFNSAKSRWEHIPVNNNNNFKSIGFFDIKTGLVCGNNGALLRTIDGGYTWINSTTQYSNDLYKLQIFNSLKAYISGSSGLLLKTTNRGITWQEIEVPVSSPIFTVFFINDDTGFFGTDSGRIYRTTNGGNSWIKTNIIDGSVNNLQFLDDQNGFASAYNLYKTTDGGLSWSKHVANSNNQRIHNFRFTDPSNGIIVGGNFTYHVFLKIVINNEIYTIYSHPEDADVTACFVTPSGKGWAAGAYGTMFYSDDYKNAAKWKRLFSGGLLKPTSIAAGNSHFYIGADRHTWAAEVGSVLRGYYNNGIIEQIQDRFINSMSIPDQQYSYIMGEGGLIRSTDEGISWESLPQGTRYIFFLNGSTGWSFGGYSNKLINKTNDRGESWTTQFSEMIITSLMFTNEFNGYACSIDKIIKSTDGGNSWTYLNAPVTSGYPKGYFSTIAFSSSPDLGIVGTPDSLFRTSDGGLTWEGIKLNNDYDNKYINVIFNNNIVITASNSTLYLSADYGSTWTPYYIGQPILEISFDGKKNILIRSSINCYILKLDQVIPVELISFDAEMKGETVILEWSTSSELNNHGYEIEKKTADIWFTIGFVKGNGTSTERNSYSFSDKSESGVNTFYRLKQIDYSGTFSYSNEIKVNSEVLLFSLEQNYPNPFNPVTIIKYHVSEQDLVTIKLLDVLGREVKILMNSIKPKGAYELKIDATELNLSSGIYIYTMDAGRFKSVKKLIVLK